MVRLPIGYYEKEVLGISRITDRPVADSIVAIAPAGSVCAKGFLLHNAHLRMNLFPLRQRHYITTIRLSTCNCPHTALKRGRQRTRPTSLLRLVFFAGIRAAWACARIVSTYTS